VFSAPRNCGCRFWTGYGSARLDGRGVRLFIWSVRSAEEKVQNCCRRTNLMKIMQFTTFHL
jgi:hypothetical protein